MKIDTYSDIQQWREASLAFVVKKIEGVLNKKSTCRLALSGGSTPRWLYEQLAGSGLQLANVEVFQVDERYVSAESPELNANMLRAILVKDKSTFQAVYFFDITLPWEKCAQAYNALLTTLTSPLFDLIILGVGPDGHTASLFPGVEALHSDQLVTTSTTEVFAGRQRLTLTPKALNQAASILVLATGKDKLGVIDRFEQGNESVDSLPLMCVREHEDMRVMYGKF